MNAFYNLEIQEFGGEFREELAVGDEGGAVAAQRAQNANYWTFTLPDHIGLPVHRHIFCAF